MKKVIVQDNQRGLLFKNGQYERLLNPGKYRTFGDRSIEVLELANEVQSEMCPLSVLLADPETAGELVTAEVKDQELGLHFVDGTFADVLTSGKHAFWKAAGEHRFQLEDASHPEMGESVPAYLFREIPGEFYDTVEVAPYQKARLLFDGKPVRVLEPGIYRFWNGAVQVTTEFFDTRLTQLTVSGQEILTRDKVSLRLNFVCSYRITDPVRALTEIDDLPEQLHVAAQLALRESVGRLTLDELLERKEGVSEEVLKKLREKAETFFAEVEDGGIKDVILPGEIREIMNTVLAAEKRAQASIITRREEVASTRSLLNTARLMEENRTLYQLKELESIERICSNVGNISLNGSGDILAQLSELLRGRGVSEE